MTRGALSTARVLSALGVLSLTFDTMIQVLRLEIVALSAVELDRTPCGACTASQRTHDTCGRRRASWQEAPSSTQFLRWMSVTLERKSEARA